MQPICHMLKEAWLCTAHRLIPVVFFIRADIVYRRLTRGGRAGAITEQCTALSAQSVSVFSRRVPVQPALRGKQAPRHGPLVTGGSPVTSRASRHGPPGSAGGVTSCGANQSRRWIGEGRGGGRPRLTRRPPSCSDAAGSAAIVLMKLIRMFWLDKISTNKLISRYQIKC